MKKVSLVIISIVIILSGYLYYISYSNDSMEVLSKYGSSGDEVKQIQKKLKDWGYYTGNVDRNIRKQNTNSSKEIPKSKWINTRPGLLDKKR